MDPSKKRLTILCAILALVAILRVVTLESPTAPTGQVQNRPTPQNLPGASATQLPQKEGLHVELALLEKQGGETEPTEEIKNPFEPLRSTVPPPPPPPPPVEVPVFTDFPEPEPPDEAEIARAAAKRALGEITYTGYLERDKGRRSGVFVKTAQTAVGGKGEPIFERFLIKDLTATTALIEETTTHAEITLQLAEKP
jgi:hypothetical protein